MHSVVFRRIGGRIVPIRSRNDQTSPKANVAKGAALAGAGAAAGGIAGHVAANLTYESAKSEGLAREAGIKIQKRMAKAVENGPLFVHDQLKRMKKLRNIEKKNLTMAKNLSKESFRVRRVGQFASAALIGLGVNKALEGTKLKDKPKTAAAVSAGAGLAGSFAVNSAYLRGVGHRGFKLLKKAARRTVLTV